MAAVNVALNTWLYGLNDQNPLCLSVTDVHMHFHIPSWNAEYIPHACQMHPSHIQKYQFHTPSIKYGYCTVLVDSRHSNTLMNDSKL